MIIFIEEIFIFALFLGICLIKPLIFDKIK